jgi:hypothetical protein
LTQSNRPSLILDDSQEKEGRVEMKTRVMLIIVLASLLFSGCIPLASGSGPKELVGSGKVATENRTVHTFSAVEVSGSGDLIVKQSDTDELSIQAGDNIPPRIETNIVSTVLHIDLNTRPYSPITTKNPIIYLVKMKAVKSLSLSGSGSITAQDISVDTLKVNINGGGTASISGTCSHLEVTTNAGAEFQAGDLQCRDVQVSANGGGVVTVWATDSLAVEGTGAIVVKYYGSPSITQSGSNIDMTSLGSK